MTDQAKYDGDSVGDLLARLTHQVGELVGKEMQLARTELRAEVSKGMKAGASLTGAAVEGLVAVVFLSSAAAWGLAELMSPGWAFLIVGAVHAVAAVVLIIVGRNKAQRIDPVPHQTMETLKEDARWAKNPTS